MSWFNRKKLPSKPREYLDSTTNDGWYTVKVSNSVTGEEKVFTMLLQGVGLECFTFLGSKDAEIISMTEGW